MTVAIIIALLVVLAVAVAGFVTLRVRSDRLPRAVRYGPAPGGGTAVEEITLDEAKAEAAIPKTEGLAGRIRSLFSRGVDDETWRGLEDALIRADVGAKAASDVVGRVRAAYAPPADPADVVTTEVAAIFDGDHPWEPPAGSPAVIMVVGVNGTGKTTTIGKLAHQLRQGGRSVTLAASDTFRAAAGEQLETWASRAGAHLVTQSRGADPGAVAFDAVQAARARGDDVVIVDTAGRLHTREPLMQELAKVRRVLEKAAGRVDEVLLVLDATTGQNGIAQARAFTEAVDVTGVVLAKMDGTARGGIVLTVREELGVPVKLVGTGERIEDLAPFDPAAFARRLVA
ncbi:MAG: signal recognition particle-docking protein FtsY [Actinomycetota bacterium]